jgi:hypothetical protein
MYRAGQGHSGEPGSLLSFVFLLVDVWFRDLAHDGFLSTREFQVPDVRRMVTAAQDERGEVGVVVMRS